IRDFHVTGVQTCALPIYDEDAVEIPEDYKELHELTGAKNPKEIADKVKDYQKKIEFALNWKKENDIKVQAKMKEKDEAMHVRDTALANQTELLAGVLQGDPEAIEFATSLMSQNGINVHKALVMPPKESFVDDAAYDLFKDRKSTRLNSSHVKISY